MTESCTFLACNPNGIQFGTGIDIPVPDSVQLGQQKGRQMDRVFTKKEMAQMLLQLIDGSGSILIDDAEYIGQGIHKLYFDRDVLVRYSGKLEEES